MTTILDTIVAHKREEIARLAELATVAELREQALRAPAPRDFLHTVMAAKPIALIAEVKRASPSQGMLRADFDPVAIATDYAGAGAHCLSILTDQHFFGGSLDDLSRVRAAVDCPLLRKDFILDVRQVYEARAAGADAVLLIAECLEDRPLHTLHEAILECGMMPLVEFYRPENVDRVLNLKPRLVGINNRDLHSFTVDLDHTLRLRQFIPSEIPVVSESGIASRRDVERLIENGIQAMLVGQSLMTASDPAAAVRGLVG